MTGMPPCELFHDNETLPKAREAIARIVPEKADDVINELLNAGILFREREKEWSA